MEYRILEINVLSANDLNNANLFTKMDAYAVLILSRDPRLAHQKFKTHVDREGGNNPSWNFPVKFRIDEADDKRNRLTLTFTIRCDRALGDKDVGTVVVPLKELYDGVAADDGGKKSSSTTTQMKFVTYQVRKPSGKPKGELHFSYKFVETEKYPYADVAAPAAAVPVAYPVATTAWYPTPPSPVSAEYQPPPPPPPAYAYPAQQYPGNVYAGYPPPPEKPGYVYPPPPPSELGYVYPPPPPEKPGYVYPPPPPAQPGYVYPPPPPPQPGYGYPPPPLAGYGYAQPQQPQNRNSLGLGLGAGLLGGALGGLLIGDLVSDAAGYDDGGFGDGWGF